MLVHHTQAFYRTSDGENKLEFALSKPDLTLHLQITAFTAMIRGLHTNSAYML